MRSLFKTTLCHLLVIVLCFSSSLLSTPLLSRSTEPLDMQWIITNPSGPSSSPDPISALTSDLDTVNEQQMVTDRLYLTTYPTTEKTEIHYADSPAQTFVLWNKVTMDNLKKKKTVSMETFNFGEGEKFSSFLFIGTEKNGAYGIRLSPKPRNLPLWITSLDNEQRTIRSMHYDKELSSLLIAVDGKGLYEMDFKEFIKSSSLLDPSDPPPSDPPPKDPSNPIYEPTIMKWGRIGQYMEYWKLDNTHTIKPDYCHDFYAFSRDRIWALTDQGIFETSDTENQREFKTWAILKKQPGTETTKGSQKVFTQAIPYAIEKHGIYLWVATNLGVFTTSDEGRNWTHIQAISPESFSALSQDNPPFIATHPSFPKEIWIASPTEVFHSSDGGTTWKSLLFNSPLAQGVTIKGLEILKTSDSRGNNIPLPIIGLSDGHLYRYMVDTTPPEIESLQIDTKIIVQNNQKLSDLQEPIVLEMKEGYQPNLKGLIKAERGSPIQDIQIQIGNQGPQSIFKQYDPNTRSFSTSLSLEENKDTSIMLQITDRNENTTEQFAFRVLLSQPDTTPPEIESLLVEKKAIMTDKAYQMNPDVFFWIKTKTPTLHGTIKEVGSGVKKIVYSIYQETKEILLTTGNDNSFSFTLPPLERGDVTRIRLFAEDFQGNQSKEVYFHIKVDASPPSISIQTPAPEKIISPLDISFSVTEDGSGIEKIVLFHQINGSEKRQLDKIADSLYGNIYKFTNIDLKEGTNTLTIQATDVAGNLGEASITITYGDSTPPPPKDTTPPQITITYPASSPFTTSNSQIVITGTITDDSPPIRATINGALLSLKQDGSFSHTHPLREGKNTITIKATDQVENQAEKVITIIYTKESSPPPGDAKPVIRIESHTHQQRVEEKDITLSGTVTDPDHDLVSVKLTLNQEKPITLFLGKDGSFQQNLTLLPGENTIEVVATDRQQHSAQTTLSITYWPQGSTLITLLIGSTSATINTEKKTLDTPPEIKANRTFVPLRFISEAFGAQVDYQAKTREIVITLGKKILTLWIGVDYIFVDNEGNYSEISLETAPYLQNGRTMLPLRYISEAFGAEIGWYGLENPKKITLLYHPKGS